MKVEENQCARAEEAADKVMMGGEKGEVNPLCKSKDDHNIRATDCDPNIS